MGRPLLTTRRGGWQDRPTVQGGNPMTVNGDTHHGLPFTVTQPDDGRPLAFQNAGWLALAAGWPVGRVIVSPPHPSQRVFSPPVRAARGQGEGLDGGGYVGPSCACRRGSDFRARLDNNPPRLRQPPEPSLLDKYPRGGCRAGAVLRPEGAARRPLQARLVSVRQDANTMTAADGFRLSRRRDRRRGAWEPPWGV